MAADPCVLSARTSVYGGALQNQRSHAENFGGSGDDTPIRGVKRHHRRRLAAELSRPGPIVKCSSSISSPAASTSFSQKKKPTYVAQGPHLWKRARYHRRPRGPFGEASRRARCTPPIRNVFSSSTGNENRLSLRPRRQGLAQGQHSATTIPFSLRAQILSTHQGSDSRRRYNCAARPGRRPRAARAAPPIFPTPR